MIWKLQWLIVIKLQISEGGSFGGGSISRFCGGGNGQRGRIGGYGSRRF